MDGGEPATTLVRVAHGDVRYARSPVLVGHYTGDGIFSAEAALDSVLGSRLSRCARLGLYPGPIETCQVFLDDDAWIGPPGAVVLGLGEVGHLTVGQLTRAVAHAVLTLALRRRPAELALSTLLIGSGAGGLGAAESVQGLLDGVRRATERLRGAGMRTRVSRVDILEIWQDRALLAVRALQEAASAGELRGLFTAQPQLEVLRGGRRRAVFSEPPGWWQRVRIDTCPDGSLCFESPIQRAGTAVRTVATQRLLVDRLVTTLVDSPSPDPDSARTLFELLVPAELKELTPSLEDVVLVLDRTAAGYPWELLQGAWIGEGGRPLGLERGVVRQLASEEFRTRVLSATGSDALVIGDTDSGMAVLPGAQDEAREVGNALTSDEFRCTTLIRPHATRVVQELFARPYRVVHIAAHGVRDLPLPVDADGGRPSGRVTGVVLGEGMYLTATEVAQMAQAPDLVFVNCCHLGAVAPAADPDASPADPVPRATASAGTGSPSGAPPPRRDYHRMAASLAAELIDAGVRAVVVCGWAVDDEAATTFATTLYENLLGGKPFGEAVVRARVETWEKHQGVNTWGAYQCYADPDFRLTHRGRAPVDRRSAPPRPACVEEVLTAVDNIAQSLSVARSAGSGLAALGEYRHQLAEVAGGIWLANPRVQVRLVHAYVEAGQIASALEWFERAAADPSGALTLHDVAVGAELAVRVAAEQVLSRRIGPQEGAAAIDAAIVILGGSANGSVTDLDQLWRLGLAHQRRAHACPQGRTAALGAMAECFRAALTASARPHDRPRAGVLAQLVRAELSLTWAGSPPSEGRIDRARVEQVLAEGRSVADGTPTFWRRAVCVDLQLLARLLDPDPVTHTVRAAAELAQDYRRALRWASTRELHLLREALDFLAAMAAPDPEAADLLDAVRSGLDEVDDRVDQDVACGAGHITFP